MKTWQWIILALLVLLFGSCAYEFLGGLRSDVYHGRVVDEETGSPLVGAVVTVIWSKTAAISIEGGPNYFQNAQETITDSDGKFNVRVSPGLNWHPFTVRVPDPRLIIFQSAYEPLMLGNLARHGFKTEEALISALKRGVTVKLRRLKREELRKYSGMLGPVYLYTHFNKVPKLLQAINAQRRLAGFSPLTVDSP